MTKDPETICSILGIGPAELLDFIAEKRRDKIALELDQRLENKTIDELTEWLNLTQDLVKQGNGSKTNRKTK